MYYFSVCTLPNLNAYLHVFTAVSQSVSMTEACENYICSTKMLLINVETMDFMISDVYLGEK